MRTTYIIRLILITVIMISLSCKTKEAVVEETTMIKTKAVISEFFQDKEYHCKMNESGDMQLCFGDDDSQGDRLRKIYAVFCGLVG